MPLRQPGVFDLYSRNLRRALWTEPLDVKLNVIRASNFRQILIANIYEAEACFGQSARQGLTATGPVQDPSQG